MSRWEKPQDEVVLPDLGIQGLLAPELTLGGSKISKEEQLGSPGGPGFWLQT